MNTLRGLFLAFVVTGTLLMNFSTAIAQSQTPVVVSGEVTATQLEVLQATEDVWLVEAGSEPEKFRVTVLQSPSLPSENVWQVDEYQTGLLHDLYRAEDDEAVEAVEAAAFRGGYMTVEELYDWFFQLQAQYQNWVEVREIGQSLEGRPIYAVKITDEEIAAQKVVFFAQFGIHSRELVSPEMAVRLAEHLVASRNSTEMAGMLASTEVWLVPIVNPDGRAIVEQNEWLWRKNTRDFGCTRHDIDRHNGVDLNRNHTSVDWGTQGVSDNPCDETYPGQSAGSEPETVVIEQFVRELFTNVDGDPFTQPAPAGTTGWCYDIHSYGNYVNWPWGRTEVADAVVLAHHGNKIGSLSGYDARFPVDYRVSGSTKDWVYEATRVPCFLIEAGESFFQPYRDVEQIWNELMPALRYGLEHAGGPYEWYAGPSVVLDSQVIPAHATALDDITLTASFEGAAQVRFYLDSYGSEVFKQAANGEAVSVSGYEIPSGKHRVFAQGCSGSQVCGVPQVIGTLELKPAVQITTPEPTTVISVPLTGTTPITGTQPISFEILAAAHEGLQTGVIQFCTSWEDECAEFDTQHQRGDQVMEQTVAWLPASIPEDGGYLYIRITLGELHHNVMYGVNREPERAFLPFVTKR